MIKARSFAGRLDLLGSFISFSCAVHCLVFPVLVSMGSFLAFVGPDHHIVELVILSVSILICLLFLSKSYHVHKRLAPLVLLGLSLIIFSFAQFATSEWLETTLNVTGALWIAIAHLVNRRLVRTA